MHDTSYLPYDSRSSNLATLSTQARSPRLSDHPTLWCATGPFSSDSWHVRFNITRSKPCATVSGILKNIVVDLSPPEYNIRASVSPTCCIMASAITSVRLQAIDIVRENGLYAGIAAVVLITMILYWVSCSIDGMRRRIHVNAT
jgi:hypothetical protein